jgi:drug/metabolite transporter (DMT)-like permease
MKLLKGKLLEYTADASIITIALIWGSTFIVMKQGVENIQPITYLFFRFFLAAVLMGAIALPYFRHLSRKMLKDGMILGVYLFLTFFFQVLALKLTTATEVGILTGLYVLFGPVLSAVFYKKVPHLFSIIGVVLSAVGMMMITFHSGMHLSLGQGFGVINAFFIALYILQVDVYSKKHNVVVLTAIQITTSTVLAGLYALFFETQPAAPIFEADILYPLIYLSVFATVVCFFVQTAMQKHTTPTKAAIMFTFEPLSSAFFSYFIGGEVLGLRQYFGAALIVAAILVAEVGTSIRYSMKKPKIKAQA